MKTGNDRLSSLLTKSGRGSTSFGGLAAAASHPAPAQLDPAPASEVPVVAQEPPLEAVGARDLAAAAPAALEPLETPQAANSTPSVMASGAGKGDQPSRTPGQVAAALSKILGGLELPVDERGTPTPVIFDKQLDEYLYERVRQTKSSGGKTTYSRLIREALATPLHSEVARNGKGALKARHERFGTVRTSVVIPTSMLTELNIELGRYSNRANALSVGALVELRVLAWASQQSDWRE